MSTQPPVPGLARRVLREPLLHFLLAGAAIFAVAALARVDDDPSRVVTLSREQAQPIVDRWQRDHGRAPSRTELHDAVLAASSSEILYREGLRLGLDRQDEVVRTRVIQVASRYVDSLAAAVPADDATVRAWFATRRDRFALPERYTGQRVFFSSVQRGAEAARQAAIELLAVLHDQAETAGDDPDLGDPDAWPRSFADQSREELTKSFGAAFVTGLDALPLGRWTGPLPSDRGWEIVWLARHDPAAAVRFDDVAEQVRTAYLQEAMTAERARQMQIIRARYEVRLPGDLASAR